jgi:hypothetical protein
MRSVSLGARSQKSTSVKKAGDVPTFDTVAYEPFVETVALGPGTWAKVPPELQQTLIENAPTFLDEASDPEQLGFDLNSIRGFSRPASSRSGRHRLELMIN